METKFTYTVLSAVRLALCAGGLLLAACTKDDTTANYGTTQIIPQAQFFELGVEQEPGLESRALADPSKAMRFYFSRSDETGEGTNTFGDYGTTALEAVRDAGVGATPLTFDVPQYYLSNNGRSRFIGWYPVADTFTGGVVSWTLNGLNDVLIASPQAGNLKTPLPPFAFEHQLAQLQFEMVASSSVVVSKWGTISNITVLAESKTCEYTLSTGAVAFSGSATYAVKNFISGVLTTTATAKGDPMLVSPSATDRSLSLQITSSTFGKVTVAVPARIYEASKAYKLTLSFQDTHIAVTVVPWNDSASDDQMGAVYPIVLSETFSDSPFGIAPKLFESKDKLKWQNTASSVGATDEWDGKANTAKMTDSPVADYCRSLSNAKYTYYVPAHAQLMLLQAYQPALPASQQLTMSPLRSYWSSTEWTLDANRIWRGDYTGAVAPDGEKSAASMYVRCICDGPQPANSYPKVGTGNTIISRDGAGGIKEGALLTFEQEIWLSKSNTLPTDYNEQSPYNRVAQKFRIATADAATAATAAEAYALCANYSEGTSDVGLWRLPTQRELVLMWAMKDKLTATGLASSNNMFWSSTYSTAGGNNWQVSFVPDYGNGGVLDARSTAGVRCVTTLLDVISLTDSYADSPIMISPKSMESTSEMIWGPAPEIGVRDIYDGKGNTDKIMALGTASQYLAVQHCRKQGSEWNLPARVQAMLMWAYLDAIPAADRIIGAIWTSCEGIDGNNYPNITNAWRTMYSSMGTAPKEDKYAFVRCVRDGVNTTFGSWKYPKVENGNTIVSRDAAGGIKAGTLLTAAQKTFLMNQTSQPIYNEDSEYNKVSAKFEVASTDASTSSTWANAYTHCKSYSQSGAPAGSWRLPTLRELYLIWIFRPKLTYPALGIVMPSGAEWGGSSSEKKFWVLYNSDYGNFEFDGSIRYTPAIYSAVLVRCVRDL